MAVYDMYFYDYQIYSNRSEQPGKRRSFLCMALKQSSLPKCPWEVLAFGLTRKKIKINDANKMCSIWRKFVAERR